jgi:selenocysteine-specific elongation factor
LEARTRSIQSHGVEIECAQPGMRTALNLPDLGIDQVRRGDVVTDRDLGVASSTLTAQIEKSSRLRIKELAARPLKNGSSIYVHHGTLRVAARVKLLKRNGLEPGQKTIANLELESPIFAFIGDRFVIRDASEQHTIGGGVVLDPDGASFRDAAHLELLSIRATDPDDVALYVRSEIVLRGFVPKKTLLNKSHLSFGEISEALMRLQRDNEIVLCEEIVADAGAWQKLRSQAIAFIDNAHKENPERLGLDLNELRAALRDLPKEVFEALVAELCAADFVRKGSAIARTSHRPMLPADLEPVERRIRESLSHKPFDPAPRREIEPDRYTQHVLRFLIESGEVIEVSPDAVLLRDNFEHMKARITEFISKHGPATVSELRQALESSRRIMVPLLERLDRDSVTRRVGDKRILGRIM